MNICVHTGGGDALWLGLSESPTRYGFHPLDESFHTALPPAACAIGPRVVVAATGTDQGIYVANLTPEGTGTFTRVGGDAIAASGPALAPVGDEFVCAIQGTDDCLWVARGAAPEDWSFEYVGPLEVAAAPSVCCHDGDAFLAAVDPEGALHVGVLDDPDRPLSPVDGAPTSHHAPALCSFDGALRVALVDDEGDLWLGQHGDEGFTFERVEAPKTNGAPRVWTADDRLAVTVSAAESEAIHVGLDEGGALSWCELEATWAKGPAAFLWAPEYEHRDPEAEVDGDWGEPVATDESLEAPTLHAVLCGYGRGIGVPGDIALHRELLARLQRAGVVKVRECAVYGLDATPARVLAALDALETGPDDVVWFVFTGHGGTAQGDAHWCTRGELLRRAEVVDRVRAQPARLRVVVSDCCSSEMGRVQARRHTGEARRKSSDEVEAWRSLFLGHEGVFDVTSSSEYQYSFAGVFTPALLRDTLLRDPPRSWHVAFERARAICQVSEGALPEEYKSRFERVGARVESGQTPWAFALPAPVG